MVICMAYNIIYTMHMMWNKLSHLIITASYHLSPEQVIATNRFRMGSVSITLEWPIPAIEVTYNVSVVPQEVLELPFALNTMSSLLQWQLTVYYNISYSVSIQASFCGYSSATTLMLKYGECNFIIRFTSLTNQYIP